MNFDFKNECENEFEDNNEKSCSRFNNRAPLEIDLRADETHESNSTAWELNIIQHDPFFNFCIENESFSSFLEYILI